MTATPPRGLRGWLRRQRFAPGLLGWLVTPFPFARRELFRAMKTVLPTLRGRLLDIGCGSQPYRSLLTGVDYVGLDVDTPAARAYGVADLYYDGGVFPVGSETCDGVLCSQVFEHVFTPEKFLAEVHRVLKPGGVLVLTVPFVWDEHEQPHDFARYSSFGLRALLERTGFAVEVMQKTCPDTRVLWQLAAGYVFKAIPARGTAVKWLVQLALIAPLNLLGELSWWWLPRNQDLFLDNVVVARRQRTP